MFAQEPPGHGEHQLTHLAGEVLGLFAVGVEVERLRDVAAKVALLVVERVLELGGRTRQGDDHHRLAPPGVAEREARIQVAAREVAPRALQLTATASRIPQVEDDAGGPVGCYRIVYPNLPIVLR